ncbi:hypothetical protein [Streptomyces sp. GC420]|uniref:hypothetical protein n=1 Tax=Streptomyces sp. GC420 TaxID=2697568 RepID=UPI001FB72B97|nr:hypothetical protein [Streptomyces sp. GC420]
MNNSPARGGRLRTPPAGPRPPCHPSEIRRRVLTAGQLREHGVGAALAAARCRPGGPWQQLLPGVYLLRPGPPTGEERLHAALLYAARPSLRGGDSPLVPGPAGPARGVYAPRGKAVITGAAALALHGLGAAPPLSELDRIDRIDVLVPRTRRLRSAGFVRLLRTEALPYALEAGGVPAAPVPRAVADTVARLDDAVTVRRLLAEAVRGGYCEATAVVRELRRARLLGRPQVVNAVDALLAEGRAVAEGRLYRMVRDSGLPEPLWNVGLRLPGGPHLGGVDAYWPGRSVAVVIDARMPRRGESGGVPPRREEESSGPGTARQREHLERLGITVVPVTPVGLRDCPEQQATAVRTALMAAADRDPAAHVVVLPR